MKKDLLHVAAHQAAVEITLLRALNQPLASICRVHEHDKTIFKMIWRCEFQSGASQKREGTLKFPDEEAEKALRFVFEQIGQQADAPVNVEAEPAAIEASESEDMEEVVFTEEQNVNQEPSGPHFFGYTYPHNTSFLEFSLTDPTIKFAVRSARVL